ncbi:hypothetical protein ARMGADRAFT_1076069 [Armillaria gallica]|uniref:Heterokaryon incompatibility domain-containing protein n=1 Tax=Armillaria gallica TaxID=47427 RepID=A0A2H3EAI6_ARMGA|nr:hypothetical protein ARMGADRAFT_1076069 [Armillaria gallica]
MNWNDDKYDRYLSLPEVTISAFTERNHRSSFQSNGRVLDRFNTILGTSYTLDTPSLSFLLEDCITNGYDFVIAYSCLRQIWYTHDWSSIRAQLCEWEEEDRETRRQAFVDNRIVNPDLNPRRLWDLVSNRVVPWWCLGVKFHSHRALRLRPISHAWMDQKDRINAWTPINGYKRPAPMPKDANLKLVRIEILNLGAEYTCLEILCLRQEGGPGEHMRTEEWKLDVPTIGAVYGDIFIPVVYCLSGSQINKTRPPTSESTFSSGSQTSKTCTSLP